MNIVRLLALSAIAIVMAGCAKPASEYPEADLKVYDTTEKPGTEQAEIRGTYQEGTFFGKTSRATFVAAIDGLLEVTPDVTKPLPLSPGPHSLVVGYWMGSKRMPVAVRLEAEPGAKYIVLQEDGGWTMDNVVDGRFPNFVYVVDEVTGKTVVPKTPDLIDKAESYYSEPSGDHLASIRGTQGSGQFDNFSAYVLFIDGVYVPMRPRKLFSSIAPDYTASYRIEPGLRAIGIGVRLGASNGVFPVLLDVATGASYVIHFEHATRRIDGEKWTCITIWIDDEVSGKRIVEKVDVPLTRTPW